MDHNESLLVGLRWAHELLTLVTVDLTPEQTAWLPMGTANPIGAQYAHAICSEDAIIQAMLQDGAPLYASTWGGKTGISDPQWTATFEWARDVVVDLPALREYAAAVAVASEAYIASLTQTDHGRLVDLTSAGLGQQSIVWVLNALLIGHLHNMTGEISVLKGLQGGQGYPF